MINPIKNEKQHEEYLVRAYELMQQDLESNSQDSDEFELLSILIESYEKANYPIDPPHPIGAVLFRMDQLGMGENELKDILGSRSRIREILSGERKLTLSMIRKLNQKMGISAEILIKDYELING